KRKEVLIGFARCGCIALQSGGAGQSKMRERKQGRERSLTAMVDDLLEFKRCFCTFPKFQISQAAHILRPVLSSSFVAARSLQLRKRLCGAATIEFQGCADRRQPNLINDRELGILLSELIHKQLRLSNPTTHGQRQTAAR